MVMDAVSFTLGFGALTAFIHLDVCFGTIPTSEGNIITFYHGLQDICIECEYFLALK